MTLLQDGTLRVQLSTAAKIAASEIGWEEPVEMTETLYRKLAEIK
jgi:hypothetical protein